MRVFIISSNGIGRSYGVGRYIDTIENEVQYYPDKLNLILVEIEFSSELKNTSKKVNGNVTKFSIPIIPGQIAVFNDGLLIEGIICLLVQHFKISSKDIFHFNSFANFEIAVALKKKFKSRIVYTSHISSWHGYFNSIDEFYKSWTTQNHIDHKLENADLERRMCDISDKIICLSSETYNLFQQAFGIKKLKLIQLNNGLPISVPKSNNIELKEKWAIKHETVILFCGRIDSNKGINDLIDALSLVKETQNEFVFFVVGGGPIPDIMSKHPDLWSKVIFTGFIKDVNTLHDIYSVTDIMVLPSYYEQNSFALLEGLQHEIALLLSSIPAFDIIEEPDCLKFPIHFSDDKKIPFISRHILAEKLLYLINHPDARMQIAKRGNKLFQYKFNSKHIFLKLAAEAYGISLNT